MKELRDKLAQQEAAKRYHEYVKTLLALGDALADPEERVQHYGAAAELYATRFANQAEAARAYEKVLEIDPSEPKAIAYLREVYEKRRDWEKLIALMMREAEGLAEGSERAQKYKQIALLATEKVKKPEVCIDLWAVVLANDAEDVDALNALAGLYERAREYEKLADVLEKLAELTYDTAQKIELLNKLGQVAGDRLKDEERAVEAYRMLLTLSPDDRRAQEQLKKSYLTLGRWDDLEVFYAESGKWDEFIRVLESNESRATDDAQRIGDADEDRRALADAEGQDRSRGARLREGARARREEPRGRRAPRSRSTRTRTTRRGSRRRSRSSCDHVADPDEKLALLREVAALYEGRLNDKPKAFERYLAAFELAPGRRRARPTSSAPPSSRRGWDAGRRGLPRGDRRRERIASAQCALRLRLGRVLVEELGRVDDALAEYRAVYESEPENATALGALERLYQRTERWNELLDVYAKKRELVDRCRREEAHPLRDRAALRAADSTTSPPRSTRISRCSRTSRRRGGARRARRALPARGSLGAYADVLRKRIELDGQRQDARRSQVPPCERSSTLPRRRHGALENYREILFLDGDHEGARVALEGLLQNKTLQSEAAAILESIYEARGDWEKLIAALEILAASTEDGPRKVALLRKIGMTAAIQLGQRRSRARRPGARAVRKIRRTASSRRARGARATCRTPGTG